MGQLMERSLVALAGSGIRAIRFLRYRLRWFKFTPNFLAGCFSFQ